VEPHGFVCVCVCVCVCVSICLFVWGGYWGFSSGPRAHYTGLYHLKHTPCPFGFHYIFWYELTFLHKLCGATILLLKTPTQLEWQIFTTTPSFFWWYKVTLTFCQDWPQISILPISASRVADMRGMSHCAQFTMFLNKEVVTQEFCIHSNCFSCIKATKTIL
jgi:hypothetical protein